MYNVFVTFVFTYLSQVLMNSLWFDKDLKSATDSSRIHHQLAPNTLSYEEAVLQVGLSVCLSLCLFVLLSVSVFQWLTRSSILTNDLLRFLEMLLRFLATLICIFIGLCKCVLCIAPHILLNVTRRLQIKTQMSLHATSSIRISIGRKLMDILLLHLAS